MLLIIVVVFLTVFAVFVLVTTAAGGRSTPSETVRTTLESVLKKVSIRARDEIVVDLRKQRALSAIPWLDRLLGRVRPAAQLRRLLEQADLPWTPGRVLLISVAGWVVVGYAINFEIGAPALAALLGLPAGAAPFLYIWSKRQRRFRLFLQKLPDAIDLMVSTLRAGNSTMGALGTVASDAPEPVRREFRTCFDEQSYGVEMRAAMENLVARVPLPDLRITITAILIQKESGGNLAEVLDKTAQVIRERFRLYDQIRVHTAQGRITGVILSLFPVVIGVVLTLIHPQYIGLLFSRPLGHKMLAAAAIMNLFGWLVIRKIIKIEV